MRVNGSVAKRMSRACSRPTRQLRCQAVSSSRGAEVVQLLKSALGNAAHQGRLHEMVADRCSGSFRYSSDLWSCSDVDAFKASVRSFKTRSEALATDYTERVVSVSQLGKGTITVKWRARWVPDALKWLDDWGKVWPGVTVEYYDVLHRYGVRTQFRWKALFRLLGTALITGVLRIPESAIEGQMALTLSEDGSRIDAATESIWIVPMFRSFRVKNRRVAKDMLLWQEMRQPAGVPFEEWDKRFMDELHIDDVPGMGQFDIDGLDEGERDNNYANVLLLMGMTTVLLISFGVSYGLVHMQTSQADQYLVDSYRMLTEQARV